MSSIKPSAASACRWGVKVEVLAEGVKREKEGGLAFGQVEGGAVQIGDWFLGDGAQTFEEAAMSTKAGAQEFGQS